MVSCATFFYLFFFWCHFCVIFVELFHTERSHVRNLKVLDRLFFRPILENSLMSREMVERLFPNLEDVIRLHTKYNQLMKDKIKHQGFPIGDIGDILKEMVIYKYRCRR